MNSQRRGRSRFPSQSARQEWVPRGPAASVPDPPAQFNSNPVGIGAPINHIQTLNEGVHRGSNGDSTTGNVPPSESIHRGHNSRGYKGNGGNSANCAAPPNNLNRGSHLPRRSTNRRKDSEKARNDNRQVEVSKDPNLPQLVQEIHEKLTKGNIECMICYDMVRRSAPIWSCSSCYSIFHLNCVKKWVRAPTSVDLSAEKNQGFNWRCPGCQSVQLTSLKEIRYVCFCRKRPDPPTDLYLTPHSCGEPCGKPLEKEIRGQGESKEDLCPHVCVLQCHPGPCPPCKAFAPPRLCPCGKKIVTTRCSDQKSVSSCGHRCDKLLDCWRHRCERVCHIGPCDPCQILVNASCFCKKKAETVLCGDMTVKGEVKGDNGVFSCSATCGKKLACGNHSCSENCHPGPCGECDLGPSRIKTCYCGATSLQKERESCLDPIPTCSQLCRKLLPCGIHQCNKLCHSGDCSPCLVSVTQKCRCGSTSRAVECFKTTMEDKFRCERSCGRKKNCGRHRCSERCCPILNSDNFHSRDWDPHFCSMACGKKLRCGQHSCESLCHSGHCPPCLETIFSDLTCACGRTSIPPPLPCGTPPPSCQLPCSISQPCGHPSSHSCHFGDCPPCSMPVSKECIGGHVILRNIPCGSKDIRCNKLCGKTRQCGMHACARTCHAQPCDSSCRPEGAVHVSCGQTCGAPRRDCRHTCTAPCHPSSPCPDLRCDFPVTITCSCGRISATVPCDAGGSSGNFSADTVFEASIIQKLPAPLQPVEVTGKKVPLGQRKLLCDNDCAKLERKRVLADAFDITPSLDALHFGDNSAVSEVVLDLFRRDPKWVLAVEERCKCLVLGKNRGSAGSLKVHVFCPMLKEKGDAVKLIAERWKVAVNAAGWEPKRFIVIHATPKSKIPARVLGVKGSTVINASHSPAFDPLVDMDPRLVVSFQDLPREADISALVLRFGGECELVWMNDKNALAVFSDPARAATAMRRLEHGSVYHGAAVFVQNALGGNNAWGSGKEGGGAAPLRTNPWKKAVVHESSWGEDPWVGEEWSGKSAEHTASAWMEKEAPITASMNRWRVLDPRAISSSSSSASSAPVKIDDHGEDIGSHTELGLGRNADFPSAAGQSRRDLRETEASEVVDDWEKALE